MKKFSAALIRIVVRDAVLGMLLFLPFLPRSAGAQQISDGGDESGASSSSGRATARLAVDAPMFYSVERSGTLYRTADKSQPYLSLRFQEPLSLIRNDGAWSYVETADGGRGYVASESISNVWIRVSKKSRTVYVYRGSELVEEIPADLAYNFFSDKEKQGSALNPDHWRTPVGKFFIVARNPASTYHRAFVLNYPSAEDAQRGLEDGLITQSQYAAIVKAEEKVVPPPMNTALGGLIEIHGRGTGTRTSWTQGCIAIPDADIDKLWQYVRVGTPVLIES